MEQKTDMNWLSMKIINYYDPDTTGTLSIFIEGGMTHDNNRKNYIPPRLKFSVRNPKVANADTQIELHYPEIVQLSNRMIVDKKGELTIYKYYPKLRKDINIITYDRVKEDSDNAAMITIKDPSSSRANEMSIYVNHIVYTAIKALVDHVVNVYAVLSTNMIGNVLLDNQTTQLDKLNTTTQNMYSKYLIQLSKKTNPVAADQLDINQYILNEKVETDNSTKSEDSSNDEPPLPSIDDKNYQTQLMNDFNLDEVKLVGEESAPKAPASKKKPKSPKYETPKMKTSQISPFFFELLNNKCGLLHTFVHGFLSTNEKSENILFNILHYISNSIQGDKNPLDDARVYKLEYMMNVMYRDNVKNYLTFFEFKPYPIVKLPEDIVSKFEEDAYLTFSGEICYLYALYTVFVQKYLTNISSLDDSNKFVGEVKIVHNFLRMIAMIFPMSAIDRDALKNYIVVASEIAETSGLLDDFYEQYSKNVPGGDLTVNKAATEKIVQIFINSMDNIKTASLEDFVVEYGKDIKGIDDVRTYKDVKYIMFHSNDVNESTDEPDESVITDTTKTVEEKEEKTTAEEIVNDEAGKAEFEVVDNLEELLFGGGDDEE